jgi:hypothetical protein
VLGYFANAKPVSAEAQDVRGTSVVRSIQETANNKSVSFADLAPTCCGPRTSRALTPEPGDRRAVRVYIWFNRRHHAAMMRFNKGRWGLIPVQ